MTTPTKTDLLARIAELEANQLPVARHAPTGDFNLKVQRPREDGTLQDLGVITASCLTYSKARGLSGLITKRNDEFQKGEATPEDILSELGDLVFTPSQAQGRDADDEDFFSAAPKRNFGNKAAGNGAESGFTRSTVQMP